MTRTSLPWAGRALAALLLGLAALPAPAAAEALTPGQFSACVQSLADQVGTSGRRLAREDFLRFASEARYEDRSRQGTLLQTSEPTFWWDDLAATTDDERVREGQAVLARNAEVLRRIEDRFGVPKEIIVAIYGIESNYGAVQGNIPVLDAAVSLACLRPCPPGARTCASRERAYAAVRLLRDNKVRPDNYVGSWAAAFGRTQFVPDSYEQLATDFDGDGVPDIVGSEPDAFATAANHLRTRGGWNAQAPVYVEVRVPAASEAALRSGGDTVRLRDQAAPASTWAARGWQAVGPDGAPRPLQLPGDPALYPFLPVGLPGPAFLVSRNFDTVMRYNQSTKYVMKVAVLADKLAGGPGIVTPWPTDDPGLSRAQVRELQAWLKERGHAQVEPDGVPGRLTRDAIEAERARKGMPPGRRVGQRTMRELMQP